MPRLGSLPTLGFGRTFILAMALSPALAYNIARDYSGPSFFDGWDFYGSWDNLTLSEYFILSILLRSRSLANRGRMLKSWASEGECDR